MATGRRRDRAAATACPRRSRAARGRTPATSACPDVTCCVPAWTSRTSRWIVPARSAGGARRAGTRSWRPRAGSGHVAERQADQRVLAARDRVAAADRLGRRQPTPRTPRPARPGTAPRPGVLVVEGVAVGLAPARPAFCAPCRRARPAVAGPPRPPSRSGRSRRSR